MYGLVLAALGATLAWGYPHQRDIRPLVDAMTSRHPRRPEQKAVLRAIIPDDHTNQLIIIGNEAAYLRIMRMIVGCPSRPSANLAPSDEPLEIPIRSPGR